MRAPEQPWKSSNLPPWEDKTCAWRWQFEFGNIWCTNKLHTTEALTRWNTSYYDNWRRVWETPPVRPVHILYPISSKPRPRTTESLGHSFHCSHWRQSRTPNSLRLVPVTTKHKSLHGACNRHLPIVGQHTAPSQAAENRTWWFLSSLSGSTPWPQWNGMSFFQDPLWALLLQRGRKQWPFIYFWCLYCGNYISITGTPALRSFIYVDVGEPTRHPCSMTGMMQDHHLLQLGVTWDIYLRELLCHREEVLSGMRIFSSESVVFHLVFWVSPLLCCFGLCLCLGLFCFDLGRHLAFCFSPVLEQCENSWSKTIRFDDRQSLERARHELQKSPDFILHIIPRLIGPVGE